MAIISSDSEVVAGPKHSNLNSYICPSWYLDHFSVEHDSVYFSLFIDFIWRDFGFKFIAGSCAHYVLVSAEKVLLTRSEAVYAEASNHDGPIGPPRYCIPGCLRVAPATGWHRFESKEVVEVALSLETQQLISFYYVFLVEDIRITQSLCFVIKIQKVWRALC